MKRNGHFWTPEDRAALPLTRSFGELATIALKVVARMPKPIGQVCGPISTGGLGSIQQNLIAFDATIDQLMSEGVMLFDQMPFEEHILRVVDNKWGTRYNNQLLKEFYLPIFESGHVSRLYFMYDWQSSAGATWEHEQARRLGFEITYLQPIQMPEKNPAMTLS